MSNDIFVELLNKAIQYKNKKTKTNDDLQNNQVYSAVRERQRQTINFTKL